MDAYTATEAAYKNGFEDGYNAAIEEMISGTNEPLTFAELQHMDDKAVWVICNRCGHFEFPALIEVFQESVFLTNNLGMRMKYTSDFGMEDDCVTIYRRKP